MSNENSRPANQADKSIIKGNIPAVDMFPDCSKVSLKELFAKPELQEAAKLYVTIPKEVIIKKLKNPFENKETKTITQKVEVMSGTTIEDAVSHELTLLDTTLDPVAAVNKKYRIIDYTFTLTADMSTGKFSGYAAKGLKLMVTRLEEVKGDGK